MSDLKPIETVYNGYRFRSRTEARWAVFFDALGLKWEYEKEGFDLGKAGCYLPDFWLPGLKLWVEVKGELTWVSHESGGFKYAVSPQLELCETFRNAQMWPIACVVGQPGNERVWFFATDATDGSAGAYMDEDSCWCVSNGRVTLDVHICRDDRNIFTQDWEPLPWFKDSFRHGCDRAPIEQAYRAARSARFEYGEKGAPGVNS